MATYRINPSGGLINTSTGKDAPKASGVYRTTASGFREVEVDDVEKIRAFSEQKKKEAEKKKALTEQYIEDFKSQRNKRLGEQKQVRRKRYATIERVTNKGTLTQQRKPSGLQNVQRDFEEYTFKANQDIAKEANKEYEKLNKEIEKINLDIKNYKPKKKVFVSSYYAPVKGKIQNITFESGKNYEKAVADYKKEFNAYQEELKKYNFSTQEGYTFVNPKGVAGVNYTPAKNNVVGGLNFNQFLETKPQTQRVTVSQVAEREAARQADTFALAYNAGMEARETAMKNNVFRVGFEPLDFLTRNFAGGSSFVFEAGKELTGNFGRNLYVGSLKRDIKLYEDAQRFDYNNIPSYDIRRVNRELAIRYSSGQFRGGSLESVKQTPSENVYTVGIQEAERNIAGGYETGRLIAGTVPFFIPQTSYPAAIAAIGTSRTKSELIENVVIGGLGAGAIKFGSSTGRAIPLAINKYTGGSVVSSGKGLRFIQGARNVLGSTPGAVNRVLPSVQKYGIPVLSGALIGASAIPAYQAASFGDLNAAKEMDRRLTSMLGGVTIGSMVGGATAQQLSKPIDRFVFKETVLQGGGALGKLTPQQRSDFLKYYEFSQRIPKNTGRQPRELYFENLEALQGLSKADKTKAIKILRKTFGDFNPYVQGSSAAYSQITNVKVKPVRKFGDIDVSYGSDKFMKTLYKNFKAGGFDVKLRTNPSKGTNKNYLTLNNKEFVNAARDFTQYAAFYRGQNVGSVVEFPSTSFRQTKSGVNVLGLRYQVQEKLYGGFMKAGRGKDITDLAFIYQNTKIPSYSFKSKVLGSGNVWSSLKNIFNVKLTGTTSFFKPSIKGVGKTTKTDYYYNGFGGNYYLPITNQQYYAPIKNNNYYSPSKPSGYKVPKKTSYSMLGKPNYPTPTTPEYYVTPNTPNPTLPGVVPYYPKYPGYKTPKFPPVTPPPYPTPYKTKDPPIPKTTNRKSKKDTQKVRDNSYLYNSYVRRNNNSKWVKVTKKALPINAAFNQGLFVADNSLGRSVRVKRAGRNNSFVADDPFINSQKFRKRKGRSKVPGRETIFVEKSKFALDSFGEKKGISAAKFLRNWRLF